MGLVLRILLSLALVLNGISGAWAMEGAMAAAKAPATTSDAAPSCHDHLAATTPATPDPDPSDCCNTAACQCACAHLPAAAFLGVAIPASLPRGTDVAAPVIHRRAAPPLPHQHRPPIA